MILILKLVTFLDILLNVKYWCILTPSFSRVTGIELSGSFEYMTFQSKFINNSRSLPILKNISMRLSLIWYSSFVFIEWYHLYKVWCNELGIVHYRSLWMTRRYVPFNWYSLVVMDFHSCLAVFDGLYWRGQLSFEVIINYGL